MKRLNGVYSCEGGETLVLRANDEDGITLIVVDVDGGTATKVTLCHDDAKRFSSRVGKFRKLDAGEEASEE